MKLVSLLPKGAISLIYQKEQMVPISIPKFMLAFRLPQCHKYLVYISKPMLGPSPSLPIPSPKLPPGHGLPSPPVTYHSPITLLFLDTYRLSISLSSIYLSSIYLSVYHLSTYRLSIYYLYLSYMHVSI